MFMMVFRLAPVSVLVYPLLVPISWLMTLLSYVMSPIIAGISMATGSNQVQWLGWFYTHDASLDGGIEQNKDGYDPNATGFKLWWQRVSWIARNPAYRFNAYVLGYSAEASIVILESGTGWPPVKHWVVIELKGGKRIFSYRNGSRWFGWKPEPIGGRHQLKSKPF
ncbi:hypothetical protein [Rhizobium sp. S163]|uniref:DUF7338 family protein n=1 Tax=Rhizobium sp. S163 TaxID=3055039 RepID=UPI0025A99D44|nr:hypothetical protein [Rhizobium sp. S163]MDM9643891.1 hypothetical protein [Rhizobium sp. S163]